MTKVLVAEDERDVRELVTMKCEVAGYTVVTAATGPDALAAARSTHLDIAVLDVRMPGLSGVEICRELRADAATADLPVILLSGYAEDDVVETGLAAGADDFMIKPFSPRDLVMRIEAVLDWRRSMTTGGLTPSVLATVATRSLPRVSRRLR